MKRFIINNITVEEMAMLIFWCKKFNVTTLGKLEKWIKQVTDCTTADVLKKAEEWYLDFSKPINYLNL